MIYAIGTERRSIEIPGILFFGFLAPRKGFLTTGEMVANCTFGGYDIRRNQAVISGYAMRGVDASIEHNTTGVRLVHRVPPDTLDIMPELVYQIHDGNDFIDLWTAYVGFDKIPSIREAAKSFFSYFSENDLSWEIVLRDC